MKKELLFVLAALLCAASVTAQSVSKQINDIRRSDAYITAEATMETSEKAYEVAKEMLAKQIEDYVAEQSELKNAPNVIVKDVAKKAEQLQMNRGQMVRVFLYVKMSDIMAAENTQILVQPANAAKANGTPKASAPKAGKQPDATPVTTPTVTPVKRPDTSPAAVPNAAPWQQAVIDELLACANDYQVQQKLDRLRAQKKVRRYGTPDRCSKPTEVFWIILDAEGNVHTILGPATGEERTNLRTNSRDALSNYQDKGAIWFTLANHTYNNQR